MVTLSGHLCDDFHTSPAFNTATFGAFRLGGWALVGPLPMDVDNGEDGHILSQPIIDQLILGVHD